MRRIYSQLALYEKLGDKNFELTVFERKTGDLGVALFQLPANGTQDAKVSERVVSLWGFPLRRTTNQILKALRSSDYDIDSLAEGEKTYRLEEEQGVKLGLLFMAIKPLQKKRRIDELADTVRYMSSEEAYYWYSLCSQNGYGKRARRAFRILFSEE